MQYTDLFVREAVVQVCGLGKTRYQDDQKVKLRYFFILKYTGCMEKLVLCAYHLACQHAMHKSSIVHVTFYMLCQRPCFSALLLCVSI